MRETGHTQQTMFKDSTKPRKEKSLGVKIKYIKHRRRTKHKINMY